MDRESRLGQDVTLVGTGPVRTVKEGTKGKTGPGVRYKRLPTRLSMTVRSETWRYVPYSPLLPRGRDGRPPEESGTSDGERGDYEDLGRSGT